MKTCDDCGVPLAVSAYRVRHAHDSYEDCIAALRARLAKVEPVYEAAMAANELRHREFDADPPCEHKCRASDEAEEMLWERCDNLRAAHEAEEDEQ